MSRFCIISQYPIYEVRKQSMLQFYPFERHIRVRFNEIFLWQLNIFIILEGYPFAVAFERLDVSQTIDKNFSNVNSEYRCHHLSPYNFLLQSVFPPGPGCVHLRLRVQVAGRPEGGLSDQRPVVGGSTTVQQIFRLDIQKQFHNLK